MKEKNDLAERKYIIAAVAIVIVVVYIIRLFTLQITSDDYKKSADSNAFLKKVDFPSRGLNAAKIFAARFISRRRCI